MLPAVFADGEETHIRFGSVMDNMAFSHLPWEPATMACAVTRVQCPEYGCHDGFSLQSFYNQVIHSVVVLCVVQCFLLSGNVASRHGFQRYAAKGCTSLGGMLRLRAEGQSPRCHIGFSGGCRRRKKHYGWFPPQNWLARLVSMGGWLSLLLGLRLAMK